MYVGRVKCVRRGVFECTSGSVECVREGSMKNIAVYFYFLYHATNEGNHRAVQRCRAPI
jgi:hypothetical protein